tara:strand:- start:443 stop:1258 length:816 start_codon:yes stop_codon:yes gene_type:complete
MQAYASILATDDFLPGILALASSLKKAESRFPFICFVTDPISKASLDQLEYFNINYKLITPLVFESKEYLFERFKHIWTKLRLFEQDNFSRLVYLDADMCLLKNIDELFEINLAQDTIAMAPACVCNPEKHFNYPKHWKPENCFFNGAKKSFYGNAGFLVLEPNGGLFRKMMCFLKNQELSHYLFVDQDFLNDFFKAKITPLSYVYNTLKTCLVHHPDVCQLKEVKAIHYILDKPWETNKSPVEAIYKDINAVWQDIYRARFELLQTKVFS